MLKGKSKAFKPKAIGRRAGGAGGPSRDTTREPTQEIITSTGYENAAALQHKEREAGSTVQPSSSSAVEQHPIGREPNHRHPSPTPSTLTSDANTTRKRKERDNDTQSHPPSKRIATPPPTNPILSTEQESDPALESSQPTSPLVTHRRNRPSTTPTQSRTPLPPAAVRVSAIDSDTALETNPSTSSLPRHRPSSQVESSQDLPSISDSTPATILRPQEDSSGSTPNTTTTPSQPPIVGDSTIVSFPSGNLPTQSSVTSAPTLPTPLSTPPESTSTSSPESTPVTNNGAPSSSTGAQPIQISAGGSLGAAGSGVIPPPLTQNVSAPSLGGAGDVGGRSIAGPSQGSHIIQMAALNPDGTSAGVIEPAPAQKKKTVVRRKKVLVQGEEGDDRATIEMQVGRPRVKKTKQPKQKKPRQPPKEKQPRRPRERAATPEGAEDEEVDPTTMKMADLCNDLGIGKKFSKHDEIKAREQKRKDDAKLARENPELEALLEGLRPGEDGATRPAGDGEAVDSSSQGVVASQSVADQEAVGNPQNRSVLMRIVDGQIVVDEASIQIDLQQQAQAEAAVQEVIVEDDFSRLINSGTYMKKVKNIKWDEEAIEKLYLGISWFGSDWEMIAKMFRGLRNRHQIVLRYKKENRENPKRMTEALTATPVPVDLALYEKLSGEKFKDIDVINAEHQALADEHQATLAANEAQFNESMQRKKDAIHGRSSSARHVLDGVSDDEDDGGRSSAKENRAPSSAPGAGSRSREASAMASGRGRKKQAKPSKANKHSMRAGGDEVEILGTID